MRILCKVHRAAVYALKKRFIIIIIKIIIVIIIIIIIIIDLLIGNVCTVEEWANGI